MLAILICTGQSQFPNPEHDIVPVMETQDSKRLTRLIGLILDDEATIYGRVPVRIPVNNHQSSIINKLNTFVLNVKNIKQQLWSKLTAGITSVCFYFFLPKFGFLSVICRTHFINGSAFCPFPIHLKYDPF